MGSAFPAAISLLNQCGHESQLNPPSFFHVKELCGKQEISEGALGEGITGKHLFHTFNTDPSDKSEKGRQSSEITFAFASFFSPFPIMHVNFCCALCKGIPVNVHVFPQ